MLKSGEYCKKILKNAVSCNNPWFFGCFLGIIARYPRPSRSPLLPLLWLLWLGVLAIIVSIASYILVANV